MRSCSTSCSATRRRSARVGRRQQRGSDRLGATPARRPRRRAHGARRLRVSLVSPFSDALVLVCEVHRARGWTAWQFAGGRRAAPVGERSRRLSARPTSTDSSPKRSASSRHATSISSKRSRAPAATRRAATSPISIDADRRWRARRPDVHRRGSRAPRARRREAVEGHRRVGPAAAWRVPGGAAARLAADAGARRRSLPVGRAVLQHLLHDRAAARAARSRQCPRASASRSQRHGRRRGHARGVAGCRSLHVGDRRISGPRIPIAQIKDALENCKLSFDLLREDRLMDEVLRALSRGRLVGWFHGRLEWGPRALGHRSVLADPLAPHTLDNLNGFLKRRPALSQLRRQRAASQRSTNSSRVRRRRRSCSSSIGRAIPKSSARFCRRASRRCASTQSTTSEPRFLRLLELWGDKTGTPVLVNTSFNGFHEPLVCSPRDAIRVFYGTGLDVLALEDFVVRGSSVPACSRAGSKFQGSRFTFR